MRLSVSIQTSAEPVPAVPPWFGEGVVIAQYLGHVGLFATIEERVRFARRRFGHYELVDFVVVLLGYAISGECTLEAFYESVQPFAAPFMALFGRERLPHRSTLSRFLTALNQAAVNEVRRIARSGGFAGMAKTQRLTIAICGTDQPLRGDLL